MTDTPPIVARLRKNWSCEGFVSVCFAQKDMRNAADTIEALLAALEIVSNGLRTGHIEDQTLIRGEEMIPLGEVVRAAIAKARQP